MAGANTLRLAGPQIAALSAHIRALAGDDDEAWLDTLSGETDAVGAARAVVRQIIETDAQADALKTVAATYSERKKAMEARVDRLRGALLRFMLEIGEKTLPLPEATVSISAGQPSLIGDPDVDAIPQDYVRITKTPDRTLIRKALIDGFEVEGCALSNAEPRLTVRVK